MGRRRTKRTSLLSVVVLEVGSLLGIVALAQPSLWEAVTGRGASTSPSAPQTATQTIDDSFAPAPRVNVFPASGTYARVPNYPSSDLLQGNFSQVEFSTGEFGVVAQQRVDHTAEHSQLPWWSRQARW